MNTTAPDALEVTAPPPAGDVLARFDHGGPRYTSYPTADRFGEAFTAGDAMAALAARRACGSTAPLSLYVHLPFCESVCYYCACNKVITRHHERAAEYLDALDVEIGLYVAALGGRQPVSQLHLGGGTPTFLSDAELQRLMQSLRRAFVFAADAELSIEVDPRTVSGERLAHLAELGFNRISLGVQDFDPAVQRAVHRIQPFASVSALMQSARRLGFASINVDLIHGLPCQTEETFARTVAQVAMLAPDRIALYAYAHLPERFKPQRRIAISQLPLAADRVAMMRLAVAGFLAHGYVYIGMDHFALPGDALAVAKRQGRLHRNFQGYSTQPDCDLVALGCSAISRIGSSYYQNAKTLPAYYRALRELQLPVERGVRLDAEDELRRAVIMALMCQGRLDFAAVEGAHPALDFRSHFAAELARLQPYADAGLVNIEPQALQVTAAGWYLVRSIAGEFDAYRARRP